MKYLIITDIHGSPVNLKKVLEKESFDKLLLLGDILPHGPRNDLPIGYNPKELLSILNPLRNKIICVRGNCDAEVDDMVLEFPIMSIACIEYNGKNIYLTHGHKFNTKSLLNVENSIILYGHTHITSIEKVDSNIYVNIGSITLPKDGVACYATLENNVLEIKNIEGVTFKNVNL